MGVFCLRNSWWLKRKTNLSISFELSCDIALKMFFAVSKKGGHPGEAIRLWLERASRDQTRWDETGYSRWNRREHLSPRQAGPYACPLPSITREHSVFVSRKTKRFHPLSSGEIELSVCSLKTVNRRWFSLPNSRNIFFYFVVQTSTWNWSNTSKWRTFVVSFCQTLLVDMDVQFKQRRTWPDFCLKRTEPLVWATTKKAQSARWEMRVTGKHILLRGTWSSSPLTSTHASSKLS